MKFETALNVILDINERYENSDKEKTSKNYYEMLHSALSTLISGCSEEQYKEYPEYFRNSVMKLELNILSCCSKEYCDKFKKYQEEKGRFHIKPEETKEDKVKAITKCKQQIGFVNEEGINV